MADVYLKHFGVKGMKWGVRKTEESSTGDPQPTKRKPLLSPNQKKVLLGTAFMLGAVGAGVLAQKVGVARATMSKEDAVYLTDPRAMFNETLAKGHAFFRQSTAIETALKTRTYAFSDAKDIGSFRGAHDVTVTAREAIRVATTRQARDALATVVDKKEFVKNRKTVVGKIAAATMTREGIANNQLRQLGKSWWKSPDSVAVMKILNEQGYNAITDVMMGGSAKILFGDNLFDVSTTIRR